MAGSNQSPSTVGLALAGGGPEGAIYEIGALKALDEALEGIDFTDLPIYVGVSAGAFVGACLANRLTPTQLVRSVVQQLPYGNRIRARTFFTPALTEYLRRGLAVPRLVLEALWDYATHGDHALLQSFSRLCAAVPVALFDSQPVDEFLEEVFNRKGRTNDFRQLKTRLTVVAADLDTAQPMCFGQPGADHVPISKAVAASGALPGLYAPVLIDGHYYVDGVLLKTLHASVALEQDADFVICVNPIVPIDTAQLAALGTPTRNLVDHGLPLVLAQTLRTLVHSRMQVGMAAYGPRYPDRDVVLFEPRRDDALMFFTNIFSFASRKAICEHAYHATRADLLQRYDDLSAIFGRHGIRLCREVLEDGRRNVWTPSGDTYDATAPVTETLDRALARLEALVDEKQA
jgi:predicted acylesterase/phospholipase RssA